MASHTALIFIDPYNDFIHPAGKLYSALVESLKDTDTITHMHEVLAAARAARIPVYYVLHQQYKPGNYDGWQQMTANHVALKEGKVFEEGSWGARIFEGMEPVRENGDVVLSKHWNSSSFQNTDLDFLLRQREITHVVFAGLVTNTCVETTARYAYELTDATAAFSTEQKNAATNIIWPLFAQKVTTTAAWTAGLKGEKREKYES
ncbi:hypothetical protein LTR16_000191 [Cryomyces antarcticus]|uniref:Isochorismatase-like domain-containing protein n=1 Tax=Cryomyces antarcticus TaxID=329879 RepID=A0ABR0KUW3_9PEZI|nr:hypothetical protein LTR39_000240 [Cryomyces antarcticus]KAK5131970.1 hypothetical protein LTR16_000191 [Cryomyces antarcticus]